MNNENLNIEISNYLKQNWDQIIEDLDSIISIPSSVNDGQFSEEYPHGTGACKAMEQALSIAKRMGFSTKNHKNVIGIADYKGVSETEIAFIGHCDVVPPGPGWKFNPYKLNIINDYLIGRGILDDKGPMIILLHAANFWIQKGEKLPFTLRFLFGTDEETFSNDIKQFKKDFDEPRIVITPDSDFPVPYGEKGLMHFKVTNKIDNPTIINISAGESNNAVCGSAIAKIDNSYGWIDASNSKLAHAISVDVTNEGITNIKATGRSAHAAVPYEGIDSIAVLSQFLLEKNIGNTQEQEFLKFISKIAGKPDGEEIGINCQDEHFGKLTIAATMLRYDNGNFEQYFDVRFPTTITENEIIEKIKKYIPNGAKYEKIKTYDPFLMNPDSDFINALAKAYHDATGEEAKKFAAGGATYARAFKCGTSFGPLRPWIANPAWVGSIHCLHEGVSIKEMQTSFNIYVYAIKYLMDLDIDNENFIFNSTTL